MARRSIATPGGRGIEEVDLVFERATEKPTKVGGEWVVRPIAGEQFALYRDVGQHPRKMYLSREETEELLGLIAEELHYTVRYDSP